MGSDTTTAKAYPTDEQYVRWRERADELDMSTSEFIQNMVEAGMKVDQGLDVAIQPDESVQELREQRNDMKSEVERLRERVSELEDRLHDRERASIVEYVDEYQMASFEDLLSHVRATAPERVTYHLDALAGDELRVNDNGLYYLADADAEMEEDA